MIMLIEDTYKLMLKYSFKPDKSKDQYFIINQEITEKIISLLNITNEDVILEIGPGIGNLTKQLINTNAKKIIAIDKDKLMCDILKKEINSEKLEIINGDFLDVDLERIHFTKITGLIPYSISNGIIDKINATKPCVFVTQKEFAEKLVADAGFKNYVAISVLTQTYGNAKIEMNVSRKNFYPIPNVDSVIVSVLPKRDRQEQNFNYFVKTIFRFSNKDLINEIKYGQNVNKDFFEKIDVNKIPKEYFKKKIKQLSPEAIQDVWDSLSKK